MKRRWRILARNRQLVRTQPWRLATLEAVLLDVRQAFEVQRVAFRVDGELLKLCLLLPRPAGLSGIKSQLRTVCAKGEPLREIFAQFGSIRASYVLLPNLPAILPVEMRAAPMA